ncbi:MAG TPA: extracellular solute-binding protein [Negativicutes bacterium]|nr:extracellular solute-binding protein [Negativicutes bacterium]
MKKVISILLAMMLCLSLLGACKGTVAETASVPATTETTEATEAVAEAALTSEPMEISIMSWHAPNSGDKYYDGIQYVMDAYTAAHPNVTFKFEAQPLDGYVELLDTQFISGKATDIIFMQQYMMEQFTDKGVLLSLDPYMFATSAYNDTASRWVDTFTGGEDSFLKMKTSNAAGAIMSVPNDSSSAFAMSLPFFYNKNLFKQAGIEKVPETYAEFIDALKKLDAIGVAPVAGEHVDRHVSWSMGWIGEQLGEHYYDKFFDAKYNGSDKLELRQDKDAIIFANGMLSADDPVLQDICKLLYEYSQYWQDGWTGAAYQDAKNLFLMQKAGMFQEGFWAFTEYSDIVQDFEWGVMNVPMITKESSAYASEGFVKAQGQQEAGYCVNGAVAQDEAKLAVVVDFLQFLSSAPVQQEYVDIASSLSPVDGVTQPDAMALFSYDTTLCTKEAPVNASFIDYGDSGIWGGNTEEYLTGKIDMTTFIQRSLDNSKLKAINDCLDKLVTLPQGIADAEAALEKSKADGAADVVIQSQENALALLKLKLEMYQQYCGDL